MKSCSHRIVLICHLISSPESKAHKVCLLQGIIPLYVYSSVRPSVHIFEFNTSLPTFINFFLNHHLDEGMLHYVFRHLFTHFSLPEPKAYWLSLSCGIDPSSVRPFTFFKLEHLRDQSANKDPIYLNCHRGEKGTALRFQANRIKTLVFMVSDGSH